jgi:hypothetical protein
MKVVINASKRVELTPEKPGERKGYRTMRQWSRNVHEVGLLQAIRDAHEDEGSYIEILLENDLDQRTLDVFAVRAMSFTTHLGIETVMTENKLGVTEERVASDYCLPFGHSLTTPMYGLRRLDVIDLLFCFMGCAEITPENVRNWESREPIILTRTHISGSLSIYRTNNTRQARLFAQILLVLRKELESRVLWWHLRLHQGKDPFASLARDLIDIASTTKANDPMFYRWYAAAQVARRQDAMLFTAQLIATTIKPMLAEAETKMLASRAEDMGSQNIAAAREQVSQAQRLLALLSEMTPDTLTETMNDPCRVDILLKTSPT